MSILSNDVNTKSRSNYDEDLQQYISGMKGAYEKLKEVVEKHGSLLYNELFEFYTQIAILAIQANRHDFLIITAMKLQMVTDFVLKNID